MIELACVLKTYQTEVGWLPLQDRQRMGTMPKMLQKLMSSNWAVFSRHNIQLLVSPFESRMRKVIIKRKRQEDYDKMKGELFVLKVLEVAFQWLDRFFHDLRRLLVPLLLLLSPLEPSTKQPMTTFQGQVIGPLETYYSVRPFQLLIRLRSQIRWDE